MDIQFCGANCLIITTKQARVVIDDTLADLGAQSVSKPGDILLFTGAYSLPVQNAKIVITSPGEYEVSGVSIYGIQARAHADEASQKRATIYKLILEDTSILITGHIYPELSDSQLESIGMVDVMVVPVGGNGYTLDGTGALKLARKIEPKLVIPTHYDDRGLKFPVSQQPLEEALKTLGMEPKDTVAKLRLNPGDLGDTTQLIVLSRT